MLQDLVRLTRGGPRVDRDVAAALLREFGSLSGVIGGSPARMRRAGADPSIVAMLRCCHRAMSQVLLEEVVRRPVIGSSTALLNYLRFELRSETVETFRTLYLNGRHELIMHEVTATGTIDSAPFLPREIIGRALELGATSLVIAHNHPSGDPRPSSQDLESTHLLARLCEGLDILLIDHVIVGRGAIVSLRRQGLLE